MGVVDVLVEIGGGIELLLVVVVVVIEAVHFLPICGILHHFLNVGAALVVEAVLDLEVVLELHLEGGSGGDGGGDVVLRVGLLLHGEVVVAVWEIGLGESIFSSMQTVALIKTTIFLIHFALFSFLFFLLAVIQTVY